jgi:hypothetical protein
VDVARAFERDVERLCTVDDPVLEALVHGDAGVRMRDDVAAGE